ncbi:hypothetical protein EYF80_020471 [Liparis tanakae]|uniref:Uncharacterized protein n=1 Tax=Liparis tanakae TaxID=230148 RepID=A0A4Z2HUL5_9TELE|nr:hypothetical protein EYF80_020471 [Liparis tanakae]
MKEGLPCSDICLCSQILSTLRALRSVSKGICSICSSRSPFAVDGQQQGAPGGSDLADDVQVFVAGKRVVLQAAVHLAVPVSPLHVKLCQRLGATRLMMMIDTYHIPVVVVLGRALTLQNFCGLLVHISLV